MIYNLVQNEVHFGDNLEPEINASLQRAAQLIASKEDSLSALFEAYHSAPEQLEVLIALYKFYFYQGKIEQAESLVMKTLEHASQQGEFSQKWELLSIHSANWQSIAGPERVYLYSLKALAFIRLKQENFPDAKVILTVLQRLDPDDQVGADVIRSLFAALQDEDDND